LTTMLLGAATATAQITIGIDDLNPLTGGGALGFLTGLSQSTLNIYSADALRQRGICAGAVLTNLEVVPWSGSGTY
jgi:hypothetical protein